MSMCITSVIRSLSKSLKIPKYIWTPVSHLTLDPFFWTFDWLLAPNQSSLLFFHFLPYTEVSNKPGICVKVLSLEPHSCQLQEEMAQLADCALPPELRVRTWRQNTHRTCCFNSFSEPMLASAFFAHSPQVGFGELPFNRVDHFPTYPDICFRVDGYNFLCHKVQIIKLTQLSSVTR